MVYIDYYFVILLLYIYLVGMWFEEIVQKYGVIINYKLLDIIVLFNCIGGMFFKDWYLNC